MISKTFKNKNPRATRFFSFASHQKTTTQQLFFAAGVCEISLMLHHGPNNVSRWMTWLPISLKNAAKCDKWYQLQNHSITESLNANGAWEKLFTSHPRACRISVSNKKNASSSSFSECCLECRFFIPRARVSGRNIFLLMYGPTWCFYGGKRFLFLPDEPRKKTPPNVFECVTFFFCVIRLQT